MVIIILIITKVNRNGGFIFADCRRVARTPDHDTSHHAPDILPALLDLSLRKRIKRVKVCTSGGGYAVVSDSLLSPSLSFR